MIGYTSRPWAWTQGSRSTPTSPKHNLTFTSRFDNGISVESYTWWNTRWVWPVKTSEFTHSKEGIGSTHQGILETYTTSFGVDNTSSKLEYGYQSRGYKLPKALYTHGKAHKVIEYEGRCRMKSNNGSGDPQRSWCEYRYSLRGRKNAEASDSRITWLVWCLNRKKLWFPNEGWEADALIKDG